MHEIPRTAQYLLRIDDLCPTVDYERWSGIRDVVRAFKVRPILAVVPDNQDYRLERSLPHPGFWEEMREMENAGATIALHGFHHECTNRAKGLLPLHRRSEFAGEPLKEQCHRIRTGLAMLRDKGLSPRLFVAPNHSFDRTTLRALCEEGLPYLSDGFARVPFTRDGVTWIPQQLWSPVSRGQGLWTICIHPNSMRTRRTVQLRDFLSRHRGEFTSFDEVIQNYRPEELSLAERFRARIALWRVMLRLQGVRKRH